MGCLNCNSVWDKLREFSIRHCRQVGSPSAPGWSAGTTAPGDLAALLQRFQSDFFAAYRYMWGNQGDDHYIPEWKQAIMEGTKGMPFKAQNSHLCWKGPCDFFFLGGDGEISKGVLLYPWTSYRQRCHLLDKSCTSALFSPDFRDVIMLHDNVRPPPHPIQPTWHAKSCSRCIGAPPLTVLTYHPVIIVCSGYWKKYYVSNDSTLITVRYCLKSSPLLFLIRRSRQKKFQLVGKYVLESWGYVEKQYVTLVFCTLCL